MIDLLDEYDLLLMEAVIVKRLRRNPGVSLHPVLEHALFIYDTYKGGVPSARGINAADLTEYSLNL